MTNLTPMKTIETIDIEHKITQIKAFLLELQNRICAFVTSEDGRASFVEDMWTYKDKGGGITRVLSQGAVIEKAGVNFSHVSGSTLPVAATAKRPELAHSPFQALGVSVVIHPFNPYVPTTHLNVRFIVVDIPGKTPWWWFGGGFDLTPYYGFDDDCVHWHNHARAACDQLSPDAYQRYKAWCDQYFYLKHRDEPRGIGGIFYDDLNDFPFQNCFNFMQAVGENFILGYQPILAKRKTTVYGERERHFQQMRRGRYVEFNLLYDRGTLFGLQSGGRTESILMSLPPTVVWEYDAKAEPGSAEARLYSHYLTPKDW